MPPFSAVVITLNEAEYIEDCLKSLHWCDEIVVLDSQSTDGTQEIAKKYADELLIRKRLDKDKPFDQLRAEAIEATSNEWIVSLDADERMSDDLGLLLQNVVKNEEPDVVKIPRKNFFFGKWIHSAGWWPDYSTRVFRKQAITIEPKLHGFMDVEDWADTVELPANHSIAINHINYETITDWVSGMNRYSSIQAKEMGYSHFLFLRGFKEFGRRFIAERGFKHGWLGFAMCSARMFYWFLVAWKASMDTGDS